MTVSIKPLKNEKVIFFHTDHSDVRTILCMPSQGCKICDYLVLYMRSKNNYEAEVICFLELKGQDLKHAVDQICDTYKYTRDVLKMHTSKDVYSRTVHSAYICIRSRAPSPIYGKREKQRLQRTFGSESKFMVNHVPKHDHTQFGAFLRLVYRDNSGTRLS